jgi:hypothetical protein
MRKTFYGTIFPKDELVEIPLDRFLPFMIRNFAQLSVERMTVISIDIDF